MGGEFPNKREGMAAHRNLSPLSISVRRFSLTSPSTSPTSYASSPLLTPTSSAVDLASSPSCSSCSSTPFSYLVSTQATDPQLEFQEPILPGLPDDLAVACLLRLPFSDQAVCRAVCHRWKTALCSEEYFQVRQSSGLAEPWLLVLAYHRATGRIQWQAWDGTRQSWHITAGMPCKERICPPGLCCVANAEASALFVCGGMCSDMDCPMDAVLKYDLFKNSWTKMGSMLTPRCFFASGIIDGRIYAAGGNSAASQELSSAEVYDPAEDRWRPVASMGTNLSRYDAAVMHGKLYVTQGWSWPFDSSPKGQIYDPKLDQWESMTEGMREGWTGPSAVLNSHLYIISENGSPKLKAFDEESDLWKDVGGALIPSHMIPPFSLSAIDGKLVVVAKNLHIVIGSISDCEDEDGRIHNIVDWQSVNAPDIFSDFIPSHSVVLFA